MSVNSSIALLQHLASGGGYMAPISILGATGTTATAVSGYLTCGLAFNNIGSSLPTPLVSFPLITAATHELYVTAQDYLPATNETARCYLARIYRFGGAVLTASGDQWTHDAATFPITRSQMGSSSAVNLLPVIFVTTAITNTAAVFTVRNVAGSVGYVNQTGNTVIGSKTFTFPAAPTSVASSYLLRLETGDCAVQDINGIDVSTTATAGTIDIYGAEIIALIDNRLGNSALSHHDAVYGGLLLADARPATPTAGSLTSYLAVLSLGGVSSVTLQSGIMTSVLNS